MASYKFFNPENLDETLKILDENQDSIIISGGTDIVIAIRNKKKEPKVVVNIKDLPEVDFIREEGDYIVFGGGTSFAHLGESPLINRYASCLADACLHVGSPQIRALGTPAGNIVTGSPAADSVPAMMALDAEVTVESVNGKRVFPLTDFFVNIYQTKIEANEVLTEIRFKKPNDNTRTGFAKLGRRLAMAIARLSVSAVIEFEDDGETIKDAKIGLGAISKHAIRGPETEAFLRGKLASEELKNEALEVLSKETAAILGSRASAVFKNESIKGTFRKALDKIW